MGINKSHDGLSLISAEIAIKEHLNISESQIVAKTRIGIHYAKEAKDEPLRSYIKNNLFFKKIDQGYQ
jgi:3-methyladenine DNA glycosylase Mpg